MSPFTKSAVLLCFGALCYSAHAADIYRWVDENGRTHLSDTVPDKYKKSARKVEARPSGVSEEQRREAEGRAAADKAKAQKMTEEKARAGSQAAPAAAALPGRERASAADDCAEQHRKYKESLACFAPYIIGSGVTRSEAFERCTPIPDPSVHCGPPPRAD
jgi:uncharacterized protein DUF4124